MDWGDSTNTTVGDGSWSGIKAQVFSATGVKSGAEILVNTATKDWQQDPNVTVLQGGNFVVTWTDGWNYFTYADHPGSLGVGGATGDTQGKAIKAQVYSAGGTPIGSEILVNGEMRSSQTAQKITALSNGNFVVTWEDWSLGNRYAANGDLLASGGGPGIKAQIFNSTGAKVGAELAMAASGNYAPQITSLANGGFVLVWHDGQYSVDDVRAQVYSAAGVSVGTEILVNTSGTGATFSTQNEERVVALSNGGFAVAWTDNNGDDSSHAVKTRVFNDQGSPVSSELLVNTVTVGSQLHSQMTALKGGGFVITWENWSGVNLGTSGIDINAQIFSNSGARVGSEILANTQTGSGQTDPQITALDSGGFAVSWWDAYGTWSAYSGTPKFQVFDALGAMVGTEQTPNTTQAKGGASPITALDNGTFLIAWNASDGSSSGVKAQLFVLTKAATFGTGNDLINCGTGNDLVDGGTGVDTAVFSGNRSTTAITRTSTGFTVTDSTGVNGTDTMQNVERLKFSDGFVALDVGATQAAGQTALLLGAVLPGRLAFDLSKQTLLGAAIDLFDQGYSLQTLSGAVMRLPIWDLLTQKTTPSNTDIATYLLTNVNGAAPDATTLANAVTSLNAETTFASQGSFLWHLAESSANQTHVGLVGLAATGLAYGV